MKKLQFTAHPDATSSAYPSQTQAQVASVLSEQLSHYGFATNTVAETPNQLQVSVESRTLPLSVSCQKRDEDGHLVCEISAHPQQEQDWFDKIATESVVKQLAQAVENSLKSDDRFSGFEWK